MPPHKNLTSRYPGGLAGYPGSGLKKICVEGIDRMAAPPTTKIRITRGLGYTTSNQIALDYVSTLQFISMVSNSYEITSEVYNRPYGDVDFKNTPYGDEASFNEQDRLIGLALHNTIAQYKFSIMKSSSFKYNKISWRFVIKGWKGTKNAIKQFMIDTNPRFEEQQRLLGVLHPVSLDLSIYDKNRKMRMLFSSKDGEDRPLTLVEGQPEDTLITYIPTDVVHQELPEPAETKDDQVVLAAQQRATQHTIEECEALMDALLVNRTWVDTYEGARNTIWAFWHAEQSDRMYQLLRKLARPGPQQSDDLAFIRKLTRENRPATSPVTLATVYWKLKELNPAGLAEIRAKFKHSYVNEIVGYERPAEWPVYEDWKLPSGYLKDLPFEAHSTLLVDSHLGTGKTTQLSPRIQTSASFSSRRAARSLRPCSQTGARRMGSQTTATPKDRSHRIHACSSRWRACGDCSRLMTSSLSNRSTSSSWTR